LKENTEREWLQHFTLQREHQNLQTKADDGSIAEFTHPVSAFDYCIALRFFITYLD